MLEIDVPGLGPVKLEHLVSDFTGTLSLDGGILPGVTERLNRLSLFLKIHVLTADTFEKARSELSTVDCELRIIKGENLDMQKENT